MTVGFPLELLALLAAPALVGAYFLRRRQQPRTVSALFLWRTPDLRAEAGSRLKRFSREISLLLELLAALVAAVFLSDLRCGAPASKQHLVIVVDGSLSMNARIDGSTAADRAKMEINRIINSHRVGALTLIETGVRPTLLAGPQQDATRALALLERWKPSQPAHDIAPALNWARELSGSTSQPIYFLTDGPVAESAILPPQVEGHSVGIKASNVALLSAQRSDEAGLAQVTVRVGNFSDEAVATQVRFAASDALPQTQELRLQPSGTAVLRVGLRTLQPVAVDIPDDALAEDGHLTLLPSELTEVTVSFLEGLDPAAQQGLRRFFSMVPGVKLASPSLLTIGPPSSAARLRLGAAPPLKSFVGPFFAQKAHSLLDDVQLGGVVWTAGKNPPGRALMSAGEVVLLSEEDDGTLHFNLDVGRSNVQRTAAWPVLLSNVVREARLLTPGFPRKHLMLGEDVPLVAGAGSSWELQGPDGQLRPVMGSGVLSLPPLSAVGRWQLKRDGAIFDSLVVLPIDSQESDLRNRGPWERTPVPSQQLTSLVTIQSRPWWPLLLMLGFLLADFWLTAAPRRQVARP